jgi:hypothetical protein
MECNFPIFTEIFCKCLLIMQTMDALVGFAEEGRSRCAIRVGEVPTTYDPTISEWGNPPVLTGSVL